MATTKKQERDQGTEGKAAKRVSATPTTPALSELKVGRALTMRSRGKEYKAEIVEQDGKHMLRVAAIKSRLFTSLSSAASAVTGLTGKQIPMRGGVAWGVIAQPNYAALGGATPAPPKTPKAKKPTPKRPPKATPTHGKVASKWECGNCHRRFPNKGLLTAHVTRDHKEAR
ncbi:MAG: hypothetical protein A2148_08460 [Chloroflexi bacterium RBG_16_68_14]|nr:MAG: hypothetical protein A2148_08460 [Chloroflexi bacterium RBG_16_68_14]